MMDKPDDIEKQKPEAKRETLIWGLPKAVASFAVIAVVSAVVYRMATIEMNLQFDFPAFLSLLLALFAVGLSALFYFKATETSNAFYDNTHKFTREVSQILGRIETGFGERLRHLDEGYTGLRDKFEKLPFDVTKAREQEKEEQEEVAKKEAEIQGLLNNLAERAQLAENEKKELFATLEQTQEELAISKGELMHLQRRIRRAEEPSEIHPGFREHLASVMRENHDHRIGARHPSSHINRVFSGLLGELGSDGRYYMTRHGLLDEDGDLTPSGIRLVRSVARDIGSNN